MSAQFDWYIGNIDRALATEVYDNDALLDGSAWNELAAAIRRVGDQLKRPDVPLIARGDGVRVLVRNPDEAAALAAIGVELVQGDIADAKDVLRAAKGGDAAIHCAALLGGASQNLADFEAVNLTGTINVLDAARSLGMRRVVALSTGTFFDLTYPGPREEAPVLGDPPNDPYTVTKLAAFREVHARAAAATEVRTPRSAVNPTSERLGYEPMSLDEGLGNLIPWLRELGKLH